MKRNTILIILILLSNICFAQKVITEAYYKDFNQRQQTELKKAKYKVSLIQENDSIISSCFKNLSTQKPVWKKQYTNFKRSGVWEYYDKKGRLINKLDLSSIIYYQKDSTINNVSLPAFKGGEEEMSIYLANCIIYPKLARINKIQGKIIVNFLIDKDGTVYDPKVVKGVDPILDEEAIRVVKKMPKWIPAKLNGTNVPGTFEIPIVFILR